MDESQIRLGIFLLILAAMAAWELAAPKRSLSQGKLKRWLGNLSLVAVNTLGVRLAIPAGAAGTALWAETHHIGLIHWLGVPDPLAILVAVVLLDLAIYAQHVVFHTLPLLWRLHMVHHADRDIDVTTGLRFHPLEILISMLFKMLVVALIGAQAEAVLIFEVVLNGMAMFNHANIALPHGLDKLLRTILVTPDMHRVHHSVIRIETNSNYGFNLSVWDRLFATYRAQPAAGHSGMTIGLDQFQEAPTGSLAWMLRLPWRGEVGQYPRLYTDRGDQA